MTLTFDLKWHYALTRSQLVVDDLCIIISLLNYTLKTNSDVTVTFDLLSFDL